MTIADRVNGFLIIGAQDKRLTTLHICVYLILCVFQSQSLNIYFPVSRREVMRLSKIRGIATYHRCIRELHVFGYIDYSPSYHPVNGSTIKLNDFNALIKI